MSALVLAGLALSALFAVLLLSAIAFIAWQRAVKAAAERRHRR